MCEFHVDTNYGQLAKRIANNFYGDIARYLAMTGEELQNEKKILMLRRRRAYTAFIRHRTVPWFFASTLLLSGLFLATIWWPKSVQLNWAILLSSALAFIPSMVWMLMERRPLRDGLRLLKSQIKTVEACLAIREVEAL